MLQNYFALFVPFACFVSGPQYTKDAQHNTIWMFSIVFSCTFHIYLYEYDSWNWDANYFCLHLLQLIVCHCTITVCMHLILLWLRLLLNLSTCCVLSAACCVLAVNLLCTCWCRCSVYTYKEGPEVEGDANWTKTDECGEKYIGRNHRGSELGRVLQRRETNLTLGKTFVRAPASLSLEGISTSQLHKQI